MPADEARATAGYQRAKAGLALRRALLTLAVSIIEALRLPRAGDALFRMDDQERDLERWADDLNEQARCILCRETPMQPDHDHIEAIL